MTMIAHNLFGGETVRTCIRLASISFHNPYPWDHRQKLLPWRCGIPFQARVLQLGELDLIKRRCEIRNRWDPSHATGATVAMLFGSSLIVVPQEVVMHTTNLGLGTYVANPAQQETNAIRDVENRKADITEQFRCLLDGRLD